MGPAKGYPWTGRGLVLGPKFKCVLGKEGHRPSGPGKAGSEATQTWTLGGTPEQARALHVLARTHSAPSCVPWLSVHSRGHVCAC